MTKAVKNVGESVRARLMRLAKSRGEDFQVLLTRFVNEPISLSIGELGACGELYPERSHSICGAGKGAASCYPRH